MMTALLSLDLSNLEADREVRWSSNVDFLVCFPEIDFFDLEGLLYAGVIDETVDFWVDLDDGFDERRDGRDIASIECVICGTMTSLFYSAF